jgi:hypothetical protein
MPKTTLIFKVPCNVLLPDDGTMELLIAISYHRGEGGAYAGPARDAMGRFVREYRAGLSEREKKTFDGILETVRESAVMKKAVKKG